MTVSELYRRMNEHPKIPERFLLERYLQLPVGICKPESSQALREYVINRIRTLAQGRFLPLFKWDGGSTIGHDQHQSKPGLSKWNAINYPNDTAVCVLEIKAISYQK